MEHAAITAGSLLTLVAVLVAYAALAAAAAHRFGVVLRSDESLALGVAFVCAICIAGYYVSRILTAISFRRDGTVVTVPLTVVIAVLIALPLAGGAALVVRRGWSGSWARPERAAVRARAAWALPAVLIVVVAAVAVFHYGSANTFRTDAGWRTDAVKELVWSDSSNVGRSPPLASENTKYTGYLATRATVTKITGDDPWRVNFAWIVMCAAAMAAAAYALARNLGLGAIPAVAGVVAIPLLGGDAYRITHVSDARGLAVTMALTGLALLARELRAEEPRLWRITAAGAVAGLAALVHVQYLVIVASLLIPAVVVALLGMRWWGGLWRRLGLATLAACVVMAIAIPQALSFGTSSIGEAAEERSATALSALLASGQTVWPPRRVFLDVPILYSSRHLYTLHPETLTADGVWGDRTAPLLVVFGALAGFLLVHRGRARPLLLVLILGALATPLLILFNPVVFPVFAKYFASYRSEYVGFEFAFLGFAAITALLRARPLLALPLVAGVVLVLPPVINANRAGQDSLTAFSTLMSAPDQREWKDVEIDTRYGDLLLAEKPLYDATGALIRRRTQLPELLGIPNFLDTRVSASELRSGLATAGGRVVLLVPGKVPARSPLRRLIDAGEILRAPRPAEDEPGVFYREVDLTHHRRSRRSTP